MKYLRVSFKIISSVVFLFAFFLFAIIINLLLFPSSFFRRKLLTKLSAFCSKAMLTSYGFKLKLKGTPPSNNGTLVIGNHMSYLDILIYLSFFECLFVTSVETKESFFIGQITTLAGCLFVERRNPRNLPNELKTIKKYFANNLSVCIFPEGTSSNGEEVLPFKKSLFQLPLETKCPIQPIVLQYQKINGQDFGPKNCNMVCWYGEESFFTHMFRMLTIKSVQAEIEILPLVDSSQFESRKEIADHCHTILSQNYSGYLST